MSGCRPSRRRTELLVNYGRIPRKNWRRSAHEWFPMNTSPQIA
jgi:hypothetical protein